MAEGGWAIRNQDLRPDCFQTCMCRRPVLLLSLQFLDGHSFRGMKLFALTWTQVTTSARASAFTRTRHVNKVSQHQARATYILVDLEAAYVTSVGDDADQGLDVRHSCADGLHGHKVPDVCSTHVSESHRLGR